MKNIEPQHLSDRMDDLEKRVTYLETKVNRPPPEDVRAWISNCYESPTDAAKAVGVSLNFIQQVCAGGRPASDKIINRMILDGFYGVDAMERHG